MTSRTRALVLLLSFAACSVDEPADSTAPTAAYLAVITDIDSQYPGEGAVRILGAPNPIADSLLSAGAGVPFDTSRGFCRGDLGVGFDSVTVLPDGSFAFITTAVAPPPRELWDELQFQHAVNCSERGCSVTESEIIGQGEVSLRMDTVGCP